MFTAVPEFKYEVAFSLLGPDEQIAGDIARAMRDVPYFLFTERERELAGDDGVERFSAVFRRETRVVVVLHREEWGKTKWTRVESEAIRSRVLAETADFLLMLVLDSSPVPAWVPESRLWADLSRLGPNGAAAVVEARIAALGAVVRPETAVEMAARIALEQDAESRRRAFLGSYEGVQAARASADLVLNALVALGPQISAVVSREDGSGTVLLWRGGFSISAGLSLSYGNTLDDSAFYVVEWKGRPNIGGFFAGNSEQIERHTFSFDRPSPGDFCWRNEGTGQRFANSDLVDWIGRTLLERASSRGR